MFYELATLSGPLLNLAEIDAAAQAWMTDAVAGTILGRWRTDIGQLGSVLVLRRFERESELAEERRRALLDRDPFGVWGLARSIAQESYQGFPFLPPAAPRKAGGIYEFRTYRLTVGGLPATLAGWEAAIEPAKAYTDHLVINMFALDGPPRILHIWGFDSLEQRRELRERHYAAGTWPPKGGPEHIDEANSVIALSNEGSPLS
ncbi:MAG: NIPSNAP family protein [Rhodospirillales bacterium 69-11]|nr:NIPSNAP family protein [Rhodospirillales bacterium]OJW26424.1 MAG: NIPSNAP family protein [Rhodospirillales bacterium 69-11]